MSIADNIAAKDLRAALNDASAIEDAVISEISGNDISLDTYIDTSLLDESGRLPGSEADDTPVALNRRLKSNGLSLLSSIRDQAVRAVFFDPQYRGVLDRLSYGNEGSRQKARARLEQMDETTIAGFISQIERILAPSGHLFLWVDKFHLVEGVTPWMEGTSLQIVDMITWNKQRMGMGYRTRRQSEYLLVIQKAPKRAKGVWTIRNIRDVWEETVSRGGHPHVKPIDLQTTLIRAVTSPGDLIVDPAAGSFSVLDAVKKTEGRYFLGSDLIGQTFA